MAEKLKVLVVDDEPGVRLLVSDIIQKSYHVFEASSAEEAAKIWRHEDLFAVLCDIKMPGEDGFSVLSEIHKEKPWLLVIMVTGHGDKEIILEALRLGAFDYIDKPFTDFELTRSLERAHRYFDIQKEKVALNISKESISEVVEKNFHGILVTDLGGRVVYLNSAVEIMFKKSKSKFLGYEFGVVSAAQTREIEIYREDRSRGVAEIRTEETTWDGKKANLIMLLDITDRKKGEAHLIAAKEQALAASHAKSAFLSNMSHEIRTPLNAIIGTASIAETVEDQPEETVGYVRTIKNAGEALLGIINDILDFSKIEAGMMNLENGTFDVRELAAEIFDIFSVNVAEKDIELVGDISFAVPNLLWGDGGRIRQILLNLIGNAVKFTDKGEVILTVKNIADENDSEANMYRFEISDSGMGISSEEQERLFQPFFQARGGETKKYAGTGLGLSLCRKVVQLMNGKIGCTSKVDHGSTFFFEIPLGMAKEQPKDERINRFSGRTALAIIDHLPTQDIMRKKLTRWGFDAHCCRDADDNLEMFAKKSFDVILIQKELDSRDGLDLAEKVVNNFPKYRGKLVVLHHTKAQYRGINGKAKEIGVSSCLSRPLIWKNLFDNLLRLVYGESASGIERFTPKRRYGDIKPENKRKILVVDDNPGNQQVCKRMVEKCGHIPDVVGNGLEAVKAAKKGGYSLILMDVQMPGMDGFEATGEIRRLNNPICDVVVVALTASVFDEVAKRCLDSGMDDYIAKPARLSDLAQCFEKWLPKADERLKAPI